MQVPFASGKLAERQLWLDLLDVEGLCKLCVLPSSSLSDASVLLGPGGSSLGLGFELCQGLGPYLFN